MKKSQNSGNKKNHDLMSDGEKYLLKQLRTMQTYKTKIRAAKERQRREHYYR